jgi:hypothetical protein
MERRRGLIAGVLFSLAVTLGAGCGDEDERYNDKQIVERLNLEKTEAGFAIDGDLFCEVDKRLLNDADEVEAAIDKDELGLVIASRQGNVGVTGRPPFAPDCADEAKKKLDKLDPPPDS